MHPIRILAAAALLSMGCAHLDYVGESYTPTERIDLYFSRGEVERDYKVMGQMIALGDQFTSAERLQARILEQARAKGADAVIVIGFEHVPLQETREYTETVTVKKDSTGGTIKKTASVSDAVPEGAEIRALFIKYR